MRLVVIDHHQTEFEKLKNSKNVEIVYASSMQDFYQKTREYLKEDYDLTISDEDPDGITSVIIYSLFKNKILNFKGNRSGLNQEQVKEMEDKGLKNVVALDWFPFNYIDLKLFSKIVYLNPRINNLPNVNTSEIIYQSLPETGKFGRDLSAIGTVCDYLVDYCQDKMNEVVLEYKELFPELEELALNGKLNRYNIYETNNKNTKFFDLSLMLWAPFILEGEEGNDKLVKLAMENRNFTLRDLCLGSENPAVSYLRSLHSDLVNKISEEKDNFNKNKKVINNLVLYEMMHHANGFMSKFSSIIADEAGQETIITMKGKNPEKPIIKYSLRTRSNKHNLGKILKELNVGGGHENAAGANVPLEKEEWFENELIKKLT